MLLKIDDRYMKNGQMAWRTLELDGPGPMHQTRTRAFDKDWNPLRAVKTDWAIGQTEHFIPVGGYLLSSKKDKAGKIIVTAEKHILAGVFLDISNVIAMKFLDEPSEKTSKVMKAYRWTDQGRHTMDLSSLREGLGNFANMITGQSTIATEFFPTVTADLLSSFKHERVDFYAYRQKDEAKLSTYLMDTSARLERGPEESIGRRRNLIEKVIYLLICPFDSASNRHSIGNPLHLNVKYYTSLSDRDAALASHKDALPGILHLKILHGRAVIYSDIYLKATDALSLENVSEEVKLFSLLDIVPFKEEQSDTVAFQGQMPTLYMRKTIGNKPKRESIYLNPSTYLNSSTIAPYYCSVDAGTRYMLLPDIDKLEGAGVPERIMNEVTALKWPTLWNTVHESDAATGKRNWHMGGTDYRYMDTTVNSWKKVLKVIDHGLSLGEFTELLKTHDFQLNNKGDIPIHDDWEYRNQVEYLNKETVKALVDNASFPIIPIDVYIDMVDWSELD